MLRTLLDRVGRSLAGYLTRPRAGASGPPVGTSVPWTEYLQPGDVLLVDGSSRVATAIKYLTQSTWSHAAICIGEQSAEESGVYGEETGEESGELGGRQGRATGTTPAMMLVEADVRDGVRTVPATFYGDANVRICRPVGLASADRDRVLAVVRDAIGHQYDLRNVIDLLRYLLPEPPVPARFRRRMLELGSGEPTRAICSTLIARAFQEVRYPIVPERADPEQIDAERIVPARRTDRADEWFLPRHHSFITPRDFDLSPFFRVVKPTLEAGFDYRAFPWRPEA